MKEKAKDTYETTLKMLKGFMGDLQIQRIVVHQFDFLMMYFPFYMVVKDLQKLEIEIEFENREDDDAIINYMNFENFESLSKNNELHIALCEPVLFNKRGQKKYGSYTYCDELGLKKGKYKTDGNNYFIHAPFINFPPLYGVALVNNPAINQVKREIMKEDGATKHQDIRISRLDYWRHFSAKLSILQKRNFLNLMASIYPMGSTTDWFIRERIKFPLKGKSWVALTKEFDDLFNGHVDVAFTVQPWAAVIASEIHEPPFDIEIVYKNRCLDYDCTSLIFKTTKKERLVIGDFILRCLYDLIHAKKDELYEIEGKHIDEYMKYYCKLLSKHCSNKHKKGNDEKNCRCCTGGARSCYNSEMKRTNKEVREGCLFENKMALDLLNDSQIYKQKEEINTIEDEADVVAKYFKTKINSAEDISEKYALISEIAGVQ